MMIVKRQAKSLERGRGEGGGKNFRKEIYIYIYIYILRTHVFSKSVTCGEDLKKYSSRISNRKSELCGAPRPQVSPSLTASPFVAQIHL